MPDNSLPKYPGSPYDPISKVGPWMLEHYNEYKDFYAAHNDLAGFDAQYGTQLKAYIDQTYGGDAGNLWLRYGKRVGMDPKQYVAWYSGLSATQKAHVNSSVQNLIMSIGNHGIPDAGWDAIAKETGLQSYVDTGGAPPADPNAGIDPIKNEIQDFINRMKAPMQDAQGNWVDPVAKQLAQVGANEASRGASNAGVEGGTGMNTAMSSLVMQNTIPYQQHKMDLAGQGASLLSQYATNKEGLAQGWARLDQQAGIDQYNANLAQNQGMGSTIGGAIGSIWGPAAGAAGSRIGGGIGGMTTGPYTPNYSRKNYGY